MPDRVFYSADEASIEFARDHRECGVSVKSLKGVVDHDAPVEENTRAFCSTEDEGIRRIHHCDRRLSRRARRALNGPRSRVGLEQVDKIFD